MDRPLPLSNSYWVQDGLLAGEYPGARLEHEARERIGRFLEAGLRCFVDLTEEGEVGLVPYAVVLEEEATARGLEAEYTRLSIPDIDVPRDRRRMIDILDTIEDALARGLGVYVHCWGGSGRTGTVVGCHLVRGGLGGAEALARVADRWSTVEKVWRLPESPQTHAQRAWVLGWSEGEGAGEPR